MRLLSLPRAFSLSLLLGCSSCGIGHELFGLGGGGTDNPSLGLTQAPPTIFGYAVADEPQAALVARQVLNAGGNAADAAAAAGFALAVTLPSRASLGGGGACIIKMPDAKGNPQPVTTILFPPGAPALAGDARPASVPMLARGLLAMQARYGQLQFASVIVPAERLAGGVAVSQPLAQDLQIVGPALLADPQAGAIFGRNGVPLQAGAQLVQPDLAATFEVLRTESVQGFYAGSFAASLISGADEAGANLTGDDLNRALPVFGAPITARANGIETASLPIAAPSGRILPASAAFMALDKNGGVVACAVTDNNLFGTGRIAPGTGILLAASPRGVPAPELAASIAYTPGNDNFLAAVTGTGQQEAAQAASLALSAALAGQPAAALPDPGRANVISCPKGVPGGEASCTATADARGGGLAIGGR